MRTSSKKPDRTLSRPSRLAARLGLFGTLLLVIALFAASPAPAAYQQVGNFAGNPGELHESGGLSGSEYAALWPEKVQLAGTGGMAVNYTGAGGVPAGTIYAATYTNGDSSGVMVARYNPDGSFSEAWQVLGEAGEYERCGPDGEAAHPHCAARPNGGSAYAIDVDVDQTTGNVYAFDWTGQIVGDTEVEVFSADGSEAITRFGERAASGEIPVESPAKLHSGNPGAGGIAVNAAGEVYVFDFFNGGNFPHRLMVFKPKTPGDYSEYEYAGQKRDFGTGASEFPSKPVTDAAGDVFAANEDTVEKYEPAKSASPICRFKFKKGGITAMTVNPKSGEVFFYSYVDHKLHRLNPCDSEGKFSEAEAVAISPPRQRLAAMAVDPERVYEAGRAAGALYAGAADPEGGETKGEARESSMGYVFAPPKELAPEVVSESVSAVTASSARLEGEVNPRGNPSRYFFQYLSDAAYQANEPEDRFAGAGEVPLGGGRLEGSATLPVADAISGLAPDTAYRYRIVARSFCSSADSEKVCEGTGQAKSFATYPLGGPGLSGNRAYELVSPAEKNGGQVFPADPQISSCHPTECKPGAAYQHFPMQSTADGEAISYEGNAFSPGEGALIENQYIAHRGATGWQSANITPPALQSKGRKGYMAFDPGLHLGLLEQANPPLNSLAPPKYANFYTQPTAAPLALDPLLTEAPPHREPVDWDLLYAGASTDLSRIFLEANDELNGEGGGGEEAKHNLYEWSGGQLRAVNIGPAGETVPGAHFGADIKTQYAISADGRRAFWSDEAGQVYVRIDGTETLEVKDPGRFSTASSDGSKVLLDDGCLYDIEVEACEDLTGGEGGFVGLVGQSDDLSHVYFVDTAMLSGEEENEYGAKAQAGKFNLYSHSAGTTTYVATLSAADNANGNGDWAARPAWRTAQASPAGRWLAFLSQVPLSGYDNVGPCEYVADPGILVDSPCVEVFLYDSATGKLACASCNPAGAPPLGASVLRINRSVIKAQRYLTDAGRLYFDSQDSLTPFDTNKGVEDVYQFEPSGTGGCARPTGCVALISAGRSGVDSNFLAIDASGKNVFFTSRGQLVPSDKDSLIDLYDAREGGGFPVEAGSSECQGETCQPSLPAPESPTPVSSALRGAGNVVEGKHKKHKKHKHKKHRRHKRHHNRGGAR